MAKTLTILLLDFAAAIAGDLLAATLKIWWPSVIPYPGPTGLISGAAIMLLAIAVLEKSNPIGLSWFWHRYWYLDGLLRHDGLRKSWERGFAALELTQGHCKPTGIEIALDGKRQKLVPVLRDIVAGHNGEPRTVIISGDPGSGKTTGLMRLAWELAQEGKAHLGFRCPVPVFVPLGSFHQGGLIEFIGRTARNSVKCGSGATLGKNIERLMAQGKVVLLLDALDEALGAHREVMLADLTELLESKLFEKSCLIISCRHRESPGARFSLKNIFEILDLSDEAVRSFVNAYKSPQAETETVIKRLGYYHLLEPKALGRNPFWLQLIVENEVFEGNKAKILNQTIDTSESAERHRQAFWRNKAVILNQTIDALLRHEWDKPATDRAWRMPLPKTEQLQETKQALAWLGYTMLIQKQATLDRDETLTILEAWLNKRVGLTALRPQDILGLGEDAQILVYEGNPIRFGHRLLLEFMAAWALKGEFDRQTLSNHCLDQLVLDPDFWGVLSLLGGLLYTYNGPEAYEQLIRRILKHGR